MKLMVASDIHGSTYYCEQMLAAYAREKADKLLLLGDILYHGPRNNLPKGYDTKSVAHILNEIKGELLCVRGNCDTEVDQMVLDFPVLAEYAIFYLEGRMVFVTHGHVFNNQHLPMLKKGDILLHGHTHVPAYEVFDTHIYMNPGSVSIPKENSAHSYMVFEGTDVYWKDLDGTILKEVQL